MELKKISFIILMFCVCLSGCGGNATKTKILEATEPHIRKVAIMYMIYSSAHEFEGPKDEASFKAHFQGNEKIKKDLLKFGIDVDDFDKYMTSDRTGDKFEIRWGVKSYPMAPPYPVAFEPHELDGVRQVGMCGGVTREVSDDDEYDALWKGDAEPEDEPEEGNRGA